MTHPSAIRDGGELMTTSDDFVSSKRDATAGTRQVLCITRLRGGINSCDATTRDIRDAGEGHVILLRHRHPFPVDDVERAARELPGRNSNRQSANDGRVTQGLVGDHCFKVGCA
jgi:hypothetical protein